MYVLLHQDTEVCNSECKCMLHGDAEDSLVKCSTLHAGPRGPHRALRLHVLPSSPALSQGSPVLATRHWGSALRPLLCKLPTHRDTVCLKVGCLSLAAFYSLMQVLVCIQKANQQQKPCHLSAAHPLDCMLDTMKREKDMHGEDNACEQD